VFPDSEYEFTIPPEISDDEFYERIRAIATTASIRTVLEIGSSTGEGSTRAIVLGLRDNPNLPTLFCLELSPRRFGELQKRYRHDTNVKCYNLTSVSLDRYPTEEEVVEFYQARETRLNQFPLPEVLRWLHRDVEYVTRWNPQQNGIAMIKQENGIGEFGMVLIDGSEFTGRAELEDVYGADYLLLDDIGTYKNFANCERLAGDAKYELIACNENLRNGYAIFGRVDR
jgi:hypothetical protein